jgi:hypothetical protein
MALSTQHHNKESEIRTYTDVAGNKLLSTSEFLKNLASHTKEHNVFIALRR